MVVGTTNEGEGPGVERREARVERPLNPSSAEPAATSSGRYATTAPTVATVVESPEDGSVVDVDDAACALLARTSDELIGRRLEELFGPAPDLVNGIELDARAVDHPDGSIIWCRLDRVVPDLTGRAASDPDERIVGDAADQNADERHNIVRVVDVSSEIEAALLLDRDSRKLRVLTESSPDLVLDVSALGYIMAANPAAARELGHRPEQLAGVHLSDLLTRAQFDRVRAALDDALALGLPVDLSREWLTTPNGTPGWYLMRFIPDHPSDHRPEGDDHTHRCHVFIVCTNVNELVNYERRLANLALIDPLTSATNRAATFDRLQHAIDRLDRRPDQGLALAAIGIDHFTSINDALGHHAGDSALALVAEELRRTVRGQDTVGRLGGDEFIVLLEDVPSRHEAAVLGSRLEGAMRTIHFDGTRAKSLRITASVGIAWTDQRVTTDEFVARARRALAEAKRRGRARAWLEQRSDGATSMHGGPTMAELNAALQREEFELVYQPIVSALDGRPRAVEALLRWRHPEYGLLAPNRFLGWLLENGQIGPVGQWVVRASISQLGEWRRSHPALADLALHVNLTAAELALPELPALLRTEIEHAEIDPAAVCIEVTEQALSGVMVAPSTLTQVADVGVRIVLDDFGTGISSLSHLRTKPLHGIKVDRSFVIGAENDPTERSIVEGVIAIAAGLGIETTAEGVETSEQAQWLTELGCTFLQGYHFARPSAAEAVPDLIGV